MNVVQARDFVAQRGFFNWRPKQASKPEWAGIHPPQRFNGQASNVAKGDDLP
jgi:hypothetical protein